jgi:hypothetical protein
MMRNLSAFYERIFYIISERQRKVNRVDQVFIKERNLEKEKIYTSKKTAPTKWEL